MKEIMTAEEIVEKAQSKSDTYNGQRREVNRLFRIQDDSDLWPIRSRFSVIERVIRQARKIEQYNGNMDILEYALFLENAESEIVNNSGNW